MARDQQLSARQIDAISRIAQAEFGRAGDKTDLYNGIRGVVDTVINRAAAGTYGGDIEGVIDAKNQFEPINKAGTWSNLPAAKAAIKAIVAERLAELDAGAPTRPFTFFDNPTVVENRAGKEASKATVDRSRLGLVDPGSQLVGPLGGYAHNYYDKPGFEAPRGFDVSLDDDAKGTLKDWSKAYSGVGWGNLNDSPSELNALARAFPAYGPKSVYGDPMDTMPSSPVSPVERAPLGPPVASMEAPGYNFSQSFANGLGFNPQFAQPVTPQNPPAATQPGWGSIAGNAISAARPYDPLSSISPPARSTPDFGPDWGTPGLGGGFGDFTTGSNGTFQKAPPSVMSAPEPGPTGGSIAGAAIKQFAPAQVSAIPQFSSIRPQMATVTAAVAAADEEAAKNKALAEAYTPPSARDDMYGVAPTAEPATTATPKAPQVQKVTPRIVPKAVPMQPPHPPSVPMTARDLASYGLGDSPGSQLSAAIGTPSQFMGTSTSPKDFAKAVAAVAAINGNNLANQYAAQLNSNRPEIQGVAYNALQNQYAQATGQPQTKSLLGGFLGDIGQIFTGASTPQIGFSNSPAPQQGMYVQGSNGPVWANFTDNQKAINNGTAGGWGSMGFGPGTSGLW